MGTILYDGEYVPGIIYDFDIEKHESWVKEIDGALQKYNSKFFKPKDRILILEDRKKAIQSDITDYYERKQNIEKRQKATVLELETKVSGVTFHKSEVNSAIKYIVEENKDFSEPYLGYKKRDFEDAGEPIFKYDGYTTSDVELEEDPENEFDSNAIKVTIGNFFVGYLPKNIAPRLSKYIADEAFEVSKSSEIIGGPYKEFDYLEDKVISSKLDVGFKLQITVIDKSLL